MRGGSDVRCGRISNGRVGTFFVSKSVHLIRMGNGMLIICCPMRRGSDSLVVVGCSRNKLLGVCLGREEVRHKIFIKGAANATCPLSRVPPSGDELPSFI